MVTISAYPPSLSAAEVRRSDTASAVKVANSYDERPTYRDDAVTAGTAIKAMSSKISRLNDVRALERVDGVLGVTLVATDAIVDVLTEMKTLAARLQDQSLSDDMRATLTHEYNKLLPRIDELTEMASFGGRNLINPAAAQISGDLELPGGQVVEARDLRNGQGQILALTGNIESGAGGNNSEVLASFVDDLAGAFTFDGGLSQLGIGTDPLLANAQGPGTNFVTLSDGRGALSIDQSSQLTVEAQPLSSQSFFAKLGAGSTGSKVGVRLGSDEIWVTAVSDPEHGNGLKYEFTISGHYEVRNVWGHSYSNKPMAIRFNSISGATNISVTLGAQGSQGISIGLPGTVPQGHSENELVFEGPLEISDVAIYNERVDPTKFASIMTGIEAGVENWASGSGSGSLEWDAVNAALDVSLSNVLAAQAEYGTAARTTELKSQIQQRMVDAIDTATARLVNTDIDRLGSLRAAAEVREQLAQAMMQSQTTTLSAQNGLFSNALGLFDAMNKGGFRPMGLETAGARAAL